MSARRFSEDALAGLAARLWRYGLPAVEEDLARTGDPVAGALRRALARAAHLLARAESERELRDALALRLTGVAEPASMATSRRATPPGPGLSSRWPMPDRPEPALARILDGREFEAERCVWSPDGRRLVSIGLGVLPGAPNTVRLWDAVTGRPGPSFDHGTGLPNRVHDCVLPASGRWLATCAASTVWIWNADSGDLCGMFEGRLVAAAPDGAWLAIVDTTAKRRRIRVYRMPDGRPSGELDAGPGAEPLVTGPDGTWLAVGRPSTTGRPGRVALYRMPDGRLLDAFPWHPGTAVRAVTGSAAVWMVTVDDGRLRVRELPGGRVRHECDVDGEGAERFVPAPDGSWLAAEIGPPQRRRTRVWETTTGEVRATFECRLGPVHTVTPDGSWIAATLEERRTVLLDVTGDRPTPITLGEHCSPVTSYAVSPDGASLAAGCRDGTVWLWDLSVADRPADPGRAPMSSCAAAPDGSWIATTDGRWSGQGRISIWDVATGRQRRVFGSGRYGSCVVARDGTWLATAHRDAVLIWEVATGRLRHRVECPVRRGHVLISAAGNHVIDLAVAPDGTWLAAACEDGTVRLLDVATGRTRDILDHPAITGRMLRCVVAPGSGRLAYSGLDGTVVHDLPSGTNRQVDGSSRLLDISPDGSLLASGQGSDIRVWAVDTGETLHVLRGHTHLVHACRWSPDGTRLASVGDHTVRIWATAGGELETTVRLYADPHDGRSPMDCCWLPNARTLAVTGEQGLYVFDRTEGGPGPAGIT